MPRRTTRLIPVAFFALVVLVPSYAANIFEPWLTDKCPKIVETVSVEQRAGVEITKLKFLSRIEPETGEEAIIYGVLARPMTEGKHPAVLVCHGGGGYADGVASQAEAWAQEGYVAFCQDQPGICNVAKSSSTGPWITEKRGSFSLKDGRPDTSALFDGIVAALNGLSLLRSREDVDTSRVGVFGGSWGGYMTTMISGLAGDRVKAAFAVYGCGHYDEASTWRDTLMRMSESDREAWVQNLDAARRASNMRAAYFNCAAANDWFFWPGAVMATLGEITSETNQVFSPNDSHVIRVPGGTSGPPPVDQKKHRTHMETVWFKHHLAGTGAPFPKLLASDEARGTGKGCEVTFAATLAPVPLARVAVYYSPADSPWRMRWWKSVEATPAEGNTYRAVIPVEDADVPLDWYGLATDERNVTVSTLIKRIDPLRIGFNADEAVPEVFAEDFEGADVRLRWRKKYGDRAPGKAEVVSDISHSGSKSLHITGQKRWGKWGVRGEALRKSGAKGIRFFARSGGEHTRTGLDLLLIGENENGARIMFGCPKLKQMQIGPEWQRIELAWDDFVYAGKGAPAIEMLSSSVGLLQIDTPADEAFNVYLDDFALLP